MELDLVDDSRRRGLRPGCLSLVAIFVLASGCSLLYSGNDYSDGSPLLPGSSSGGLDGGGNPDGGPITGNPIDGGNPALEDTTNQATFLVAQGGTGLEQHQAATVLPNGTAAIVGMTESLGAGDRDATFLLVDRLGKPSSSRVYGGAGNDQFYSIVPRVGGGFYAVGLSRSFPSVAMRKDEGLVVRLNPDGTVLWSRILGSAAGDEILFSAASTADGGLVAVGRLTQQGSTTLTDGWVLRMNDQGLVGFDLAVGGTENDELSAVSVSPNGALVAVGRTSSFTAGNTDVFLVSLGANGQPLAARAIGGPNEDRGLAVRAEQNQVFVAGNTYSFGLGLGDGWLLALDARLDVQWSRAIGTPRPDTISGLVTTNERIYVAGTTIAEGTNAATMAIFAAAIDRTGAPVWSRQLRNSAGPMTTAFHSLTPAEDGSLVIVGQETPAGTPPDAVVARITSAGELRGPCASRLSDPGAQVTNAPITSRPISPRIAANTPLNGNTTVTLTVGAGLPDVASKCP